jgi:hypothetical protein
MQKANDIQPFVRERKAALKEQSLTSGFTKQLTGIDKEAFTISSNYRNINHY